MILAIGGSGVLRTGSPARISPRRGGLSSTTEKTTEFHVTQVMQALQQEFSLPLEDFCITLSENDVPAHYLVNIELAPGHTRVSPSLPS